MEQTLKTGRRIILKDGTTFENSNCGYADGSLWCYITGISFQDAVQTMSDPQKTEEIIYEYGEMSDTYKGFTEVFLVSRSENGCDVCLRKG